ncbi:MAG TPA: AgmX/PglI C-terminal domain-containing protein [Candidatus Binatia bacterium]
MTPIRESEPQNDKIESLLQEKRFEEAVALLSKRNRTQTSNIGKTTALAVGAIGILLLPMSYLISARKQLSPGLSILANAEPQPSTAQSAVLAVDALGLKIQVKNAPPSAQERFENVAVRHLARLHRTYSAWYRSDEDLMGSLHLKLKIDALGKVVSIHPETSYLANASFTDAVMAEVRNWKFPKGVLDGAEITVPLLFVPKGMDPSTAVQWERNIRRTEEQERIPFVLPIAGGSSTLKEAKQASKPVPPTADSHRPERIQASSLRQQEPRVEKEELGGFKTSQSVALREKPRFSSKTVHEVDRDTELTVLGNEGDWLKVKLAAANSVGFVRKEFVAPID